MKEYDKVLEIIKKSESYSRKKTRFRAAHLLWSAMAHHQLRHDDEAKRDLREAIQLIDNVMAQPGEYLSHDNWMEWIECRIIRREAEELIIGPTDQDERTPISTSCQPD